MKTKKFKKPNYFLYKLFYFACKVVAKLKFNLKVEKNELKGTKGGCVVLVNHPSIIDFFTTCVAVRRRAHFVISSAFYQTMPIKPLINGVRAISKNQFQTSMTDMKKMKEVVDNDMPLILFPAGLMTATGEGTPIPPATGKVVKWFNSDVYTIHIQGSYLTKPKWGKGVRRGKIVLNATKLVSKEELKTTTPDELQKLIDKNLSFDEYEYQKQAMIPHKKGDNVDGLQNILFGCPHCKSEFSIEVDGNKLMCSKCGYSVKANTYGLFEPHGEKDIIHDTVVEWYRELKNSLNKIILANADYTISSNATIQLIEKGKFVPAGQCEIILNNTEFTIKGNLKGQDVYKSFPVKSFPTLPFKPGKCFDLQDGQEIFRVVLENPRHTIKWITALEIMHKCANE